MAKKGTDSQDTTGAQIAANIISLAITPIVAALNNIANSKASLCLQLEACRKLKSQLIEDAKNYYPFKDHKDTDLTEDKIQKYRELMQRLESVCETEKALWIAVSPNEKRITT